MELPHFGSATKNISYRRYFVHWPEFGIRLVKEGHEVTILHRKPGHDLGPKVLELVADRNDAALLAKMVAEKRFEVVFDNVYDWERGTTAAQVEATARAFGRNCTVTYSFRAWPRMAGD